MTRAWIIGNGPSLRETPLDLLKNEVTWATNRIHLIYPQTEWRPSYYVRGESPLEDDAAELSECLGEAFKLGIPCYMVAVHRGVVGAKKLRKLQHKNCREEYFEVCEHNRSHFDENPPDCWHLPRVCTFGSSVTTAIQLAVLQGYGPLYLVGCDLGYTDGGSNHFDVLYDEDYREKLRPSKYSNGDALFAHEIAARFSPVEIFNCTVGGELETYPRMTIEEVLNGTGLPPRQREMEGQETLDGGQGNEGPGLYGGEDRREGDEVREKRSVPRKRRGRS